MTDSKQEVTPWDVQGEIDYDKLIRQFGVQKIDEEDYHFLRELAQKRGLKEHIFLKRKLFYAHMDLKKTIEKYKSGEDIFLYTGRAPGGNMHIAHLIPFEFTKYMQDLFDCNLYIEIPDDEKFLFKKNITSIKDVESVMWEDLKHISALSFNPDKTFIFRTSEYVKHMYPLLLETAKRITFSQARNIFGFEGESNIGMIFYPAMQIVPTFFEKNQCLIPCGIDQNPYFMLQRDIAQKIGYHKNATILSKFVPPLVGMSGKMSASNPDQAILLSDEDSIIKKKVNKHAFSGGQETLEKHRELGGNCSVDVSFQWLKMMFIEDDKEINNIQNKYESGEMLSGEMKKLLIDHLHSKLRNHRLALESSEKNNLLDKYMYSGKLAKEMWNK